MRSLNPGTRAKAIEFANQLLEQGQFTRERATAIGIGEARRWARLESADQERFQTGLRPCV